MSPIDRFHRHFDGLVAAMDDICGDADGWGLQCGRTVQGQAVWRKQQRRYSDASAPAGAASPYGIWQRELVIGEVTAE